MIISTIIHEVYSWDHISINTPAIQSLVVESIRRRVSSLLRCGFPTRRLNNLTPAHSASESISNHPSSNTHLSEDELAASSCGFPTRRDNSLTAASKSISGYQSTTTPVEPSRQRTQAPWKVEAKVPRRVYRTYFATRVGVRLFIQKVVDPEISFSHAGIRP